MRTALKLSYLFLTVLFCYLSNPVYAQVPEDTNDDLQGQSWDTPSTGTPSTDTPVPSQPTTTSSEPPRMEEQRPTREPDADRPLDDVVEKRMIKERRVLPYEPIREADIMWEKRVWRVIDTREKINLSFVYPEELFYKILYDAAIKGEIKTYSTEDDKFSYKLEPNEVASMGASIDTVVTVDPETYEEKIKIVRNELDPENVKRFRLKEVWFFDRESSTLKVRILGIAPLMNEYDSNGNFKFERPLFWVYYPECREVFSRHQVFNIEGNDAAPMTWEDLFEARLFSSFITKESNVYNRKLDMYLTGVDMLIEGEKIKEEIFNFEHDLWSY